MVILEEGNAKRRKRKRRRVAIQDLLRRKAIYLNNFSSSINESLKSRNHSLYETKVQPGGQR